VSAQLIKYVGYIVILNMHDMPHGGKINPSMLGWCGGVND